MLKSFILICVIFSVKSAESAWNYNQEGKDWELGVCKDNTGEQSPINVIGSTAEGSDNTLVGSVDVIAGEVKVIQIDNGHSIQLNPYDHNTHYVKATLKDKYGEDNTYQALQFHFHSPSEHFIEGKQFDLEMHIVMEMTNAPSQGDGRSFGVLGFLFQEEIGTANIPLLTEINEKIGERRLLEEGAEPEGKEYELEFEEFFKLLPKESRFWHYRGGLTTPVCTEAVNWYINKNIIQVNAAQLAKFRSMWVTNTFNGNTVGGKAQGNNRILQDLGARKMHSGKYSVEIESMLPENEKLIVILIGVVLVSWVIIFIFNFVIYKIKMGKKGHSHAKHNH